MERSGTRRLKSLHFLATPRKGRRSIDARHVRLAFDEKHLSYGSVRARPIPPPRGGYEGNRHLHGFRCASPVATVHGPRAYMSASGPVPKSIEAWNKNGAGPAVVPVDLQVYRSWASESESREQRNARGRAHPLREWGHDERQRRRWRRCAIRGSRQRAERRGRRRCVAAR